VVFGTRDCKAGITVMIKNAFEISKEAFERWLKSHTIDKKARESNDQRVREPSKPDRKDEDSKEQGSMSTTSVSST
jgi:hypothetical protein